MEDKPSHPDPVNPYNEEETARRRGKAMRRARHEAAQPEKPGGKRPAKPGPETYRGMTYSVAPHGEGQWLWKLRAPGTNGAPPASGTVRGRPNDAVEAAHRAIDKALGITRK